MPYGEPIGEPLGIRSPDSARIDGVPAIVLASPKMESISSSRTPQVSG